MWFKTSFMAFYFVRGSDAWLVVLCDLLRILVSISYQYQLVINYISMNHKNKNKRIHLFLVQSLVHSLFNIIGKFETLFIVEWEILRSNKHRNTAGRIDNKIRVGNTTPSARVDSTASFNRDKVKETGKSPALWWTAWLGNISSTSLTTIGKVVLNPSRPMSGHWGFGWQTWTWQSLQKEYGHQLARKHPCSTIRT